MTFPSPQVAVRSRWTVVVLLAAAGAVVGSAVPAAQAPAYQGTSAVFVRVENAPTLDDPRGQKYLHETVESYAALATTDAVLHPVIGAVGEYSSVDALAGAVHIEVPNDTVLITVGVTGGSGDTASAVADAIASQLVATTNSEVQRVPGLGRVTLHVVTGEPAPGTGSTPGLPARALAGLGAGALVGAGLVTASAVSRRNRAGA